MLSVNIFLARCGDDIASAARDVLQQGNNGGVVYSRALGCQNNLVSLICRTSIIGGTLTVTGSNSDTSSNMKDETIR